MSHIVTIAPQVKDANAISAACRRLNLREPERGTARLYSGEATGLILELPGWKYPIVVDLHVGSIQYDNYQGNWGEQRQLDRFLQMYAVERAKLEARRKGLSVNEQTLTDGSIKLQIADHA